MSSSGEMGSPKPHVPRSTTTTLSSGSVPYPQQHGSDKTHSRQQSSISYTSSSAAPSAAARSDASTSSQHQVHLPTLITFGNRNVRARVDREVPVTEIIRQLCASPQLSVQEPPSLFCLRDASNNELITPDNMNSKLNSGVSLKLVAAPIIEAVETIEKLQGSDPVQIKQATFALRGYIREDAFVTEFLRRKGVTALASVIQTTSGNTLAYALSAMQSLLDLDEGWDDLNLAFVQKAISIITSQALVNVIRPALSILRRLVSSDHPSFGFNPIWPQLIAENAFFKTLATRITREGDKMLAGVALALLNSIIKSVTPEYFHEAVERLEAYNLRKAVISLIENHAEDITPHILQFQQNYANIWHTLQKTPVALRPVIHVTDAMEISRQRQTGMLQSIYAASGLLKPNPAGQHSRNGSQTDLPHRQQPHNDRSIHSSRTSTSSTSAMDYRKLGFTGSDVSEIEADFDNIGLFGLYSIYLIATTRSEEFSKLVLEQVNRPDARRCPIALVSLEVSRILSNQFDLSGSLASASFQPFLLDIFRIHYLVLELFIRIFEDSASTGADIARVSMLVNRQVRMTLGNGVVDCQMPVTSSHSERVQGLDMRKGSKEPKTYFQLKQELEEVTYQQVRDRDMEEMAVEDDLFSQVPVRDLADRLYRENFEFLRSQRIACLQSGSWFTVPAQSASNLLSSSRRSGQPPSADARHRYYRLAGNRRYLHYIEADQPNRAATKAGVDDFPDNIDLSSVTEVASGSNNDQNQPSLSVARAPSRTDSAASPLPSSSPSFRSPRLQVGNATSSALRIRLYAHDTVLADFVAPDTVVFSEWMDGLNFLIPQNRSRILTQETADLIQVLTDVGVKIKLLDLSGERLDIPSALPVPIVPSSNVPFYYTE